MKTLDNELIGEWAESLREIKQIYGKDGITDIFKLVQKYLEKETNLQKIEDYLNTDYVNTIPRKNQKKYPGDILLEEKIENKLKIVVSLFFSIFCENQYLGKIYKNLDNCIWGFYSCISCTID